MINYEFMRQRAYVEILRARGKLGEHERGVSAESNSSQPPECSPNFPSAQYLDMHTAEA